MHASREHQGQGRKSAVHPRRDSTITLAGIPVAPLDETKHFKLIGTTGTGKSTAIRELLSGALRRGDRAIIADPDGGYLARFKDSSRGDSVLNPFDPESRKCDLFGEIENPYDIDQTAEAIRAALEMSAEEKRTRMQRMRKLVREQNVYKWAGSLIGALCDVRLKVVEPGGEKFRAEASVG